MTPAAQRLLKTATPGTSGAKANREGPVDRLPSHSMTFHSNRLISTGIFGEGSSNNFLLWLRVLNFSFLASFSRGRIIYSKKEKKKKIISKGRLRV
jgi:hypothetical protein